MHLQRGARGMAVEALQKKLNEEFTPLRGPGVPVNGQFDAATQRALRVWQRRVGLIPDGVAGPKTLGMMFPLGVPELGIRFHQPWMPSLAVAMLIDRCSLHRADQACTKPVQIMRMSDKGIAFLYELEAQSGVSNKLHWPGGASGVTLGAGYDMKLRSAPEVRTALLSAGVSKAMADIAAKGAGLTGAAAAEFCRVHRKEVVLFEDQERLILRQVIPAYERLVRRLIRIELQQHQFDALISFAYNPGGRLAKVTRLINAGKPSEAMVSIRAANTSAGVVLAGLTERRNKEIRLYLNAEYAGAVA